MHRKGEHHANADALSRLPTRRCPRPDCEQCAAITISPVQVASPEEAVLVLEEEEWMGSWTPEEVKNWQRSDVPISRVIECLETSSERPDWKEVAGLDSTTNAYYSQWGNLLLKEGILYRRWYPQKQVPGSQSVLQVVTPLQLRQRILQSLHNSPSGGHVGRNKTLGRVRQHCYWPHYKEHVIRWCKRCDVCARVKAGPARERAKLGHVPVGAPLERVALDIMGPVPKTEEGYE